MKQIRRQAIDVQAAHHVTRVRANEFLFVAGMLSGDAAGNIIGEGKFEVQTAQVFRNIEAALKSAGASWANVVQFTTYLVHSQDIPKFMEFRLREFPKMFPDGKYPPNTLLMRNRRIPDAQAITAAAQIRAHDVEAEEGEAAVVIDAGDGRGRCAVELADQEAAGVDAGKAGCIGKARVPAFRRCPVDGDGDFVRVHVSDR